MIYCWRDDCNCLANYKNASRNTDQRSAPKAKEVHPKILPSFKREDATLADNKENIPPNDEKEDPRSDCPKEEGYDVGTSVR